MTRDLALGVDVGTGSVKAFLISVNGNFQSSASARYRHASPRPGWAEQDPEDWWQAICAAIRQLLHAGGGLAERVAAVAVCGQGAGTILLDAENRLLRPAILWLDSRAAPESREMDARAGDQIARLSGKRPAAYNVEPKLRWIERQEPDIWRRVRTVLTVPAYCTHRLCRELAINHSDGGILLGYDLAARRWSEELSSLTGVPAGLYPRLAECDEIVGVVGKDAAAGTGLRPGTPVAAGGEDTSAAAFAANLLVPDAAVVSLGNAGTINLAVERPVIHPRLLAFPHVLRGRTLIGGSIVSGGSGLDWITGVLGGKADEPAELWQKAAAASKDAGRVVFLPYLAGELQPIHDGFARGVFLGVDLGTTAADLARAVAEGISFALAHNLELIREVGRPGETLAVVGGPARNRFLVELIASSTGLPAAVLDDRGGAALGAAMLAAKAAGLGSSIETMAGSYARILHRVLPDPERSLRLASLFSVYKEVYPRLKDLFPRLHRNGLPAHGTGEG